MTIIKLVKSVSVTGEVTWAIIDQDRVQVGPTYKNEFDAHEAFDRATSQLGKFGNFKNTQVVKEFILKEKTETDAT